MKKPLIRFKKRHFQLLEMMVAVFILLICAAPALRIYTNIFLHEQEDVRQNTRNRFARQIHSNIVERLYKHAIPFDQLLEKTRTPLEDSRLIEELQKNGYSAFYQFDDYEKKKMNSRDKRASFYLVSLTIIIKDLKAPPGAFGSSNFGADPSEMKYDYKIYVVAPEKEPDFDSPIDEESLPVEELEDDTPDELKEDEKGKPVDFTKKKPDKPDEGHAGKKRVDRFSREL